MSESDLFLFLVYCAFINGLFAIVGLLMEWKCLKGEEDD